MLTSLDHIIIGVHDLSAAAQTFATEIGLAVSGGGVHPTGGTSNRIVVIGDTYLELITVHQPSEAQASIVKRLAQSEGYLNFVLSSNDLVADSQAIRARGIHLTGPIAGALRSPDGHTRSWQRADVERPDLTQHYPFLIQHDSTGEERRLRLAGWTTPPVHPLGATKVLSVTIAVENLDEACQRFAQIYGIQPTAPFSATEQGWPARIAAFPLGTSGQTFELAAPISPQQTIEAFPTPIELRQHLQHFGESLCRMTLLVNDLASARRHLDAHAITYTNLGDGSAQLWIHPQHTHKAHIVLLQE